MTRAEIMGRLTSAVQAVAENDLSTFDESSALLDLGIDSLEFIEAIVIVERELNVKLKDSELSPLKTVSDLLLLIEQKHSAATQA